MNRRGISLTAVLLVLAIALCLLLWPRQPDAPLRLKLIRQTMENGRPVAFFQLEGAGSRIIHIGKIERISGEHAEPFDPRGRPGQTFWAISLPVPMGDPLNPYQARTQFGVISPANAQVWKLRVKVLMEPANEIERFKLRLGLSKVLRKRGDPFFRVIHDTWIIPVYSDTKMIESDTVTNAVSVP